MPNTEWEYWELLNKLLLEGPLADYTGIGSRRQTKKNFRILVRIGMLMAYRNRRLRSGAASGADEGFELGLRLWLMAITKARPELLDQEDFANKCYEALRSIFIPKNGFRGRTSREAGVIATPEGDPRTRALTQEYHPNKNLSEFVASMMDRNANQVLGLDVQSPTSGIICHTPDGADEYNIVTNFGTGGTGQAIRIAHGYGVPVSNIGQKHVLDAWMDRLQKFDTILLENLGITSEQMVNDYLDKYDGFKNVIEGDLVKALDETDSLDAMIHGCNCHCTMGSGIAKAVKEVFPGAYEADCQTKPGDKKKLGTYTVFSTTNKVGKPISVINGYTQYDYGKITDEMQEPFVDYEKLRKMFQQINKDFAGKTIGIPKIGAGLAGGEWYIIARIIQEVAKNVKIVLYKM